MTWRRNRARLGGITYQSDSTQSTTQGCKTICSRVTDRALHAPTLKPTAELGAEATLPAPTL